MLQGTAARKFFILAEGRAVLLRDNQETLLLADPYCCFGEKALYEHTPLLFLVGLIYCLMLSFDVLFDLLICSCHLFDLSWFGCCCLILCQLLVIVCYFSLFS
jgi:hypothetical protein